MKTKLNSKILISALLSFSMMIMLLSGVKAATENETLTSSNWEYGVNGENVYIMKYTGTEEDVVVPAVIDGKKVVSIGEDTFTDCKTLKNITLSENIKNIESNSREAFPCFNGCDNLENIIVDENNSEFSSEDGVLYSKNKEVILLYPRGKNVAEFVIPEHVKYLGRKVFSKCENLKRVSIANGIKDLSERVFEGCSSLESVNIPESLESIGVGAFSGCESLKNIVIPNGTKSIGIYAFSNCKSLKEIAIPSAVESLVETNDGNMVEGINGKNASVSSCFAGCTSLEKITVDSKNKKYASDNGMLFNKDKTHLLFYPAAMQGIEVIVKTGVKTIAKNTFCENKNIQRIKFPITVTKVEDGAVNNCSNLEKVTFGGNKPNDLGKFVLGKDDVVIWYFNKYKNSWSNYNLYKKQEYIEPRRTCIGMPTPVRSVKKIKLNKKKLVLKKGKKYKLKYTITPSRATNKMVTWKTTNKKIAKVSKGKVKALKKGKCYIVVRTKDGGKKAKIGRAHV